MSRYRRMFVALAVLLSGAALIPYIGLSSEPFGWEQYADVYVPEPVPVSIQDFFFSPDTVVIFTGTAVRWTNEGNENHTVTSEGGLFDSGTLQPGESFEYLFDVAGTYHYSCTIHPSMTGTVIVIEPLLYLPIILR
jgi:plastocyanin